MLLGDMQGRRSRIAYYRLHFARVGSKHYRKMEGSPGCSKESAHRGELL